MMRGCLHAVPRFIRNVAALLAVALLVGADVASSQDLAEHYRRLWFRENAERILERRGMRVEPFQADHLVSDSDSIRWRLDMAPLLERRPVHVPLVQVGSMEAVRRLERPVYEDRFRRIPRSYLGSNVIAPMDTSLTIELRARMEYEYGTPTVVLGDYHSEQRNQEHIQFEYWFHVNDTIPLVVIDVNGPFERGLVFATHAQYRELLPDLKQYFSRRVTAIEHRRHFADYYYNEADGRWYVTGYDGSRFILRRILRPNLNHGRPSPEMLR